MQVNHLSFESFEVRNILTEELSELIQAMQKMERFYSRSEDDGLIEKIQAEAGDVLAAFSLAIQTGVLDQGKVLLYAAEKLARYREGEVTFEVDERNLKELKMLKI